MSEPVRIGVFGGTFDPIHNTHIEIARAALRHGGLDEVLFVVAAQPPHKRGDVFADAEERFAMVSAALAEEKGMRASRIEIDREGPSYTADTLRLLQEVHPGAALALIVGADSLADLPRWRRPEEILSRARLLVAARPGVTLSADPLIAGRYEVLPLLENTLSSTELRDRLLAGDDVSDRVPPRVLDVIRGRGLYQPCPS